jgi:hypothetical protein
MFSQKLLKRVLIADHERDALGRPEDAPTSNDLIDYTYGITSDPLTQFAVVFSASKFAFIGCMAAIPDAYCPLASLSRCNVSGLQS